MNTTAEGRLCSRITNAIAFCMARAKTNAEISGKSSVDFIYGFNTALNAVGEVLNELEPYYLYARGYISEFELEEMLYKQKGEKNE